MRETVFERGIGDPHFCVHSSQTIDKMLNNKDNKI